MFTINVNVPLAQLADLSTKMEALMASMQEVLDLVRQSNTVGDSVVTLLNETKAKLDQALAAIPNVPPEVQAQIDQAFDELTAQKAELEAAVTANTPAEGS